MRTRNVDFFEECETIAKGYKNGPALYQASKFWEYFNERNLGQLRQGGFERFKQTANWNYFQFMAISLRDPYFLILLSVTKKLELLKIILRSRIKNCSLPFLRTIVHKWYVCMLYKVVKSRDYLNILNRVVEPEEGTPVKVYYEGKQISQDIVSSTLEFYAMEEVMKLTERTSLKFAEIGAGGGRLGYLMLSLFRDKNAKYCIFDIPPALCISQYYLSKVFPGVKVFHYREFQDFSQIEKEFNEAQLCFFLPHQMELLPPKTFDVFIAISNLPEMRLEQIKNYFKQIDRLCAGYFYNKQFWEHTNAKDNYIMRFLDYPAPSHWQIQLLRPTLGKMDFFEAVYKIA